MRLFCALFVVLILQSGCYANRTAEQICDCEFPEQYSDSTWTRSDTRTELSLENAVKAELDRWVSENGTDANDFTFRIQWYRSNRGVAGACVVYEGVDQMAASFLYSLGNPEINPIEVRFYGPSFSPREPWERCKQAL